MSDEVLNLSLRPKRFADLVGQKKTCDAILSQISSGRIPRAWMITGGTGLGKTTLARILALSYQGPRAEFGAPSDELWGQYNDFAIHEINASSVNGVDALSKVAEESSYMPPPPTKVRVYILDEAQRISDAAQNLLLKPFEEPPKTTCWIVCTTHPQKILPTLRRRCTQITMSPLGDLALTRLLERAAKAVGLKKPLPPLKEQLDVVGTYSPGLILKAVERYASGLSAQASVMSGDSELDSLRICRAFIRGDWPLIRKELQKMAPEDARLLRLSVMGYLRTILLGEPGSLPAARVAGTIMALSGYPPLEDPACMAWVSAILYQECKKYKP